MVVIRKERVQVGKNTSIIEINGNQYNAITGQLVGSAKRLATRAKKTTGFQSIDGFVRKSVAKVGPGNLSAQNTKITDTVAARGSGSTRPNAQSVHSGTQRTRTLMRSGVKKPINKIIGADKPDEVLGAKLSSPKIFHKKYNPNKIKNDKTKSS